MCPEGVLLPGPTVQAYQAYQAGKYSDALNRKLTPIELKTHRAVFVGACLSALALVVVSVWYWVHYRPTMYLFKGEIVNLIGDS